MARVKKSFVPDQEGDGVKAAARNGLYDITLKLAAIGGYNAERNIRDLDGQFIADTDVSVLTAYALHPEKIVRGKREFVELLQAAGVLPNQVLNENLRQMFGAQIPPPPPPPMSQMPPPPTPMLQIPPPPPPMLQMPPPPMSQMPPPPQMLPPEEMSVRVVEQHSFPFENISAMDRTMRPPPPLPLKGPFSYPQPIKRKRGRPPKNAPPLPPMPPLQYMGLPKEQSAADIPLPEDNSVTPGKRKGAPFELPQAKRKGGVLSDYQAINDE